MSRVPWTAGSLCFANLQNKHGIYTFRSFTIFDHTLLTRPYTSLSSRISATSGTSGKPFGGGSVCSGSRRTLGSPCEDLHHEVDGCHFWSRTIALDLWMSGYFKTVHAPSCFRNVSTVCFLTAQHRSRRNHLLLCAVESCIEPHETFHSVFLNVWTPVPNVWNAVSCTRIAWQSRWLGGQQPPCAASKSMVSLPRISSVESCAT